MAAPKRKSKSSAKSSGPAASTKIGASELLADYREMRLIRRLEEKAGQMDGMGLVGAFGHL